jgi:hypothetical protein
MVPEQVRRTVRRKRIGAMKPARGVPSLHRRHSPFLLRSKGHRVANCAVPEVTTSQEHDQTERLACRRRGRRSVPDRKGLTPMALKMRATGLSSPIDEHLTPRPSIASPSLTASWIGSRTRSARRRFLIAAAKPAVSSLHAKGLRRRACAHLRRSCHAILIR